MKRKDKNIIIKKKNKQIKRTMIRVLSFITFVGSLCIYHNHKINEIENRHEYELRSLKFERDRAQSDMIVYKSMFEISDKKINTYKAERDEAIEKYEYIQEQIKYSKLNDKGNISRGDYQYHDLREYPVITIDEMNQYIEEQTPEGSPFRGQGEVFLKASYINKVDPRYIFSHASLESSYGTSNLALTKGNYFGINAVNHDPDQAYFLGSNLEEGILEGANWIANNYIHNGYYTLDKMVERGYAVYDDGSPNYKWVNDISHIASKYDK